MSSRAYTWAALALAIAYFAVLCASAPSVGYVRDEGYYFKAAEEYGVWWDTLFSRRFFDAFGDDEIRLRFAYNSEHPALVKLLQGLSHRVLHRWLGLTGAAQAFRATGFLFAGLSLIAVYLLGRELVSAQAGLLAAALLASMPRYFYDAHLACFDVAVTAMWTLSLWSFWRAYVAPPEKVRSRSIGAGLIFGLALATKLNGLFLPVVMVAVWLWTTRFGPIFETSPSGSRDLRLPPIPWVLISCAILGPLVFYLHWPYLWHDTFTRVGAYIGFHLSHEHYPISYFHELLVKPPFPFSFPFVMSALTVPSPLLVLGVLGLGVSLRRAFAERSGGDALLLIGCLLPVLLIANPSTPIFGGVKHWYNAMPLFAIGAARAALDGARALRDRFGTPLVAPALGLLMVLPGVLGSAASHPNGIGFYNEIAGGFRGGAELGLQRGFWGGLARPTYDRLQELPTGSRVFFSRTNYDSYRMYQREGTIPQGVYYANDAKRTDAAVHFEQPEHGEKEGEICSNLGTRPIAGVYADNVVLTQLYWKNRSSGPPISSISTSGNGHGCVHSEKLRCY